MGINRLRLLSLALSYLGFAEFVSAATTPISVKAKCSVSPPCYCERNPQLVLNCRGQRLDRVPTFHNSDELVDELTLANNRLVALPADAFRGLKVRRLYVDGNQLVNVSPAAFSGLELKLEELRIQLNQTAEFPSKAVGSLTQLRVLHVIGYGGESLPTGALATLRLRELRLKNGRLKALSPTDVSAIQTSLSLVDLSSNPLGKVPTDVLATLSNLTQVVLDGCQITHLRAHAFGTSWTRLEYVDLSRNQLQEVHENAFRDVGGQSIGLRDLLIESSRLSDEHLSALRPLTRLRRLNVALNDKITDVDRLLDALTSLETLDASSDGIASFGRRLRVSSASLQVLNLARNPLMDVADDAFSGLTALQELRLDGARLSLGNDSFAAQRPTLRTLSLSRCNFTRAPFPSIAGLSALEKLDMSSCSLRKVPDFTFMDVGRLQTLDLSNNLLQQLTQRSLAGLHANLEIIKLYNNRLATVDRCVFYRFNDIDLLNLGLANNPLQCRCGLHWLYKRLEQDRYNETAYYSLLQWRCADLHKKFNQLVDADFAGCVPDSGVLGSTVGECENLIPTTTPAVTYPSDPSLKLKVAERTDVSVTVEWSVAGGVDVVDQAVTRQRLGGKEKVRLRLAAATKRRYVLTGLGPNVTYIVCVELNAANNGTDPTLISCLPTTTALSVGPSPWWASVEVIVGVWVGGGVAVLVVVIVSVYCCCAAHRRRRRPTSLSAPRQSVQTKRFRKLGTAVASPDRTSDPYNASQADVDRYIVQSVERLDPESMEVLANLLRTASAASLDHIGGTASYYPSPPPSGGYQPHGDNSRPMSSGDRHFYEELPDDQIPTDDFV